MDNVQLKDLVDAPRERLDVEYKAWLNLNDKESQARLAKHFCALANHGSGFVVFGIEDDMTPAGDPPAQAGPYDQERMSSIVKRYLTPAFPGRGPRGYCVEDGNSPSCGLGSLSRGGTGLQQTRRAAQRWEACRDRAGNALH